MNSFTGISLGLLLIPYITLQSQDISSPNFDNEILRKTEFNGFIRGGFYAGTDQDGKPYFSSAFADYALKTEYANGINFKAFADIRFRYGAEFKKPVNYFNIREAYVRVNGKQWDITVGQSIIKWGRADFTNPTSKLSPQNMISRSPDREDMDIGNLMINSRFYPSSVLTLEADLIPFYKSSVLLIDPIPLPSYIKINQIESLVTDKKVFSYGLKADLHLKGVDMGISWFDGYDPMPGVALTAFNLDLSGAVPLPNTQLTLTPFKIRNIGIDFETTIGSIGLRGEAAWTLPYQSYKTFEYVPCKEIKWVTGLDWTTGNWRFTAEYSGKSILDFVPSVAEPFIGTEPDPASLTQLLSNPDFNMEDYVRQQVGAFNRLYNYQLKKFYHSGGFRIEKDLFYGKLTPSVFTIYNFTSRDFLIIPELVYKPADGLAITVGGEYYSGRKGSIYDIIDEFMNCFRISFRVNF